MRKYLAIILCKIAKKLCKLLGRGSSFPGQVALKVCPDILSRLSLPDKIIAVTGSNGKTSSVEMIHAVIEKAGMSVAYNFEGSNQIEGVTTLIIDNCSLSGKYQKDVLLIEADERYTKYIFKYITPTYYVINNLYRDQMTRNGHPEYVLSDIKKSIREGTTLILNSDDPIISSLSKTFNNKTVFYGIDENEYVSEKCESVYDDGYYCPVCGGKMSYDFRHFAHVGKYQCLSCDFSRKDPEYHITSIDLNSGKITINDKYELTMGLKTIFNAYNVLSAFTVGSLMNIDSKLIVEALNGYMIHNGRVKQFKIADTIGTLLISKHENSISYNRNIEFVANHNGEITLMLIIDDISRKYFTSDTSWLWDISFEKLNNPNVKQIVVSGKYIGDVAIRLSYAGIDENKIVMYQSTADAVAYLKDHTIGKLFVLTCFSDEGKLIKEVEVI